jgi:hypothetical protein
MNACDSRTSGINVKRRAEDLVMRCLLVAVAIASTIVGQPATQRFSGRWSADHQERAVVRLDLRSNGDALEGWIQLADIHVDNRGEVDSVLSDLPLAATLIDVTVRGQRAAFARRDGNDIDHFEFTLLDDRIAELRFVFSDADRRELADNGIPLPKPIRLTRTAP